MGNLKMSEMITEQRIRENEVNQIRAVVHERNVYRKLLEECLFNFNQLENIHIMNSNGMTTNKLAAKIKQTFKKYDNPWDLPYIKHVKLKI